MPTELSLTQQFVAEVFNRDITPTDRQRAALHVLDWIACVALGRESQAGESFKGLLALSDSQQCSALFTSKVDWQSAIQFNGALGNVLEMDDIHRSSILHPGPVVIASALAMAELEQASMNDFLDAVIKGYELTIRLGEAIGRSHYAFFHNTATCAAFGAAMASAHLLGLSEQQTVWALGNVGSKTGGLWQMRNERVLTKQWHNAQSALSGASAALLARNGLTGPAYILEGPQGVFNALSEDAKGQTLLESTAGWRLFDCSFKPWPACRHAHPVIDCVRQCWDEKYSAEQVKKVTLFVYKDAQIFCDRPSPDTELQAKFSLQHAVAALLLKGEPQLAHYTADCFNDEDIVAMRQHIQVVLCDEIEARYPQHYGARCEIQLSDGQRLECSISDTFGDPECPMSPQDIKHKARTLLSTAGVSDRQINDIVSLKWGSGSELSALLTLLTPTGDEHGLD